MCSMPTDQALRATGHRALVSSRYSVPRAVQHCIPTGHREPQITHRTTGNLGGLPVKIRCHPNGVTPAASYHHQGFPCTTLLTNQHELLLSSIAKQLTLTFFFPPPPLFFSL